MIEPSTPVDAYKAIIDQFVNETRLFGHSSHVASDGVFSKAPSHSKYNKFLSSLSKVQRELLAEMLQEERDGAIHDMLATLTWWVTAKEVGLTFRGESMPVDLSGMGLHGDYVGRREGWEWPQVESGSKPS